MKRSYFMIYGLPRSRTAWLANYFCSESSHCCHELMGFDIAHMLDHINKRYVGVAEPNPCVWHQLPGFKSTPTLVIKRSPVESLQSHRNHFGPTEFESKYVSYVADLECIVGPTVMVVQYTDIDQYMPAIVHHLTPELPYDRMRHSQLKSFNVQDSAIDAAGYVNNRTNMVRTMQGESWV